MRNVVAVGNLGVVVVEEIAAVFLQGRDVNIVLRSNEMMQKNSFPVEKQAREVFGIIRSVMFGELPQCATTKVVEK